LKLLLSTEYIKGELLGSCNQNQFKAKGLPAPEKLVMEKLYRMVLMLWAGHIMK
jgi:hypothetical protein